VPYCQKYTLLGKKEVRYMVGTLFKVPTEKQVFQG
jgi:hypothetical protein